MKESKPERENYIETFRPQRKEADQNTMMKNKANVKIIQQSIMFKADKVGTEPSAMATCCKEI